MPTWGFARIGPVNETTTEPEAIDTPPVAVHYDEGDPASTSQAAFDLQARYHLPVPPAVYGEDPLPGLWGWLRRRRSR